VALKRVDSLANGRLTEMKATRCLREVLGFRSGGENLHL
jgi:hypothetical protein